MSNLSNKENKWDKFFDELKEVDTSEFLTDREQLPIEKVDLYDLEVVLQRKDEKTIPHQKFLKELKQDGII